MNKAMTQKLNTGTYLITGATGFVGSFLIRTIAESELYKRGSIKLVCHARNESKFLQIFEKMVTGDDKKHVIPIFSDIEDINQCVAEAKRAGIVVDIDYIIHCASNTTSSVMISNPVETIDGIVAGTKSVLELARKEKVKSMVYLSSMEVYGDISCSPDNRATEDMLGNIDILKPRSSYPLGKRMAESYCAAYANEYGVPVKIARLAQVFGMGILPGENRSFAQFARAAAEGRDIVLKTEGRSIGNSVASEEATDAILFLLDKGVDGQVYNVVNEKNTMSIRDTAELVAHNIGKDKIKVVTDIEDSSKTGYATDTGLYMSGKKLRELGWEAEKGLEEMYRDVIKEMEKHNEQ